MNRSNVIIYTKLLNQSNLGQRHDWVKLGQSREFAKIIKSTLKEQETMRRKEFE